MMEDETTMMPTAQQVLASMQLALKEHVEPRLEDKWALSALRSVDALLNHLQARVPVEGPMLHEDTKDLLAILADAPPALAASVPALGRFLADAPEVLAGYPAVQTLQALNHKGREAVGALLEMCHADPADKSLAGLHEALRAYLHRHADREGAFFFPVFVGRPV